MFLQIKKCSLDRVVNCWFCQLQPPRLPDDIYNSLHFLPDPVVDHSSNRFKSFPDVYGTATTESDRPSLKTSKAKNHTDKENKGLFVAAKVRDVIHCMECAKPRCIYAPEKLDSETLILVEHIKDQDSTYTCGSPLFDMESPIKVRIGITCTSPMEAQYYTAKLHKFPPVCYHCGQENLPETSTELDKSLQKSYTTVRPICTDCENLGKEPGVRGAKNVGKRQKPHDPDSSKRQKKNTWENIVDC